jgi:predicted nucleotidyltransferase
MTSVQEKIKSLAREYRLLVIYTFGSRAREAKKMAEGSRKALVSSLSDLDTGILPAGRLSVEEKVRIGLSLEDIFGVLRVDVVVLSEAPPFLAFEIVQGEILYAEDPDFEAEYQLHVMRVASDLLPFEREKRAMILEDRK